jgi:hypothetical protein
MTDIVSGVSCVIGGIPVRWVQVWASAISSPGPGGGKGRRDVLGRTRIEGDARVSWSSLDRSRRLGRLILWVGRWLANGYGRGKVGRGSHTRGARRRRRLAARLRRYQEHGLPGSVGQRRPEVDRG